MNIIKYLKSLSYIIVPILILNIIVSVLYYFDLIGDSIVNYLKLLMIAISMLIGGIYIGSESSQKGWLEGIKIGLIVIILFFIIGYLAFDHGITIKTLIYYFILLASSTLGGMIGINKKKRTD